MAAGLLTAVPAVAGAVTDWDRCPGDGLELGMKGGLVPLCPQEKVCSTAGDLLGVIAPGMHRVGDEQDPARLPRTFSTASTEATHPHEIPAQLAAPRERKRALGVGRPRLEKQHPHARIDRREATTAPAGPAPTTMEPWLQACMPPTVSRGGRSWLTISAQAVDQRRLNSEGRGTSR